MKLFYSKAFRKDFFNLPKEIQKIAERKLKMFCDNFYHPSLRIKKIKGLEHVREGRITSNYRFTFTLENNSCILRRIGTHDILKKQK